MYINGKYIDLNELIDIKRSGQSGKVYKYNDLAVKISKRSEPRFNEYKLDIYNRLKEVQETKRIIMPKDLIYDEFGNIIGYTMPFVNGDHGEAINKLTIKKFLEEIKVILEDIKILVNHSIIIDDHNPNNIKVNENGIYLIDTEGYAFKTSFNYEKHLADSLFNLNNLIKNCFTKCKYIRNNYNELNAIFNNYDDICGFFLKSSKEDELVETYIKRLIRKEKVKNMFNF